MLYLAFDLIFNIATTYFRPNSQPNDSTFVDVIEVPTLFTEPQPAHSQHILSRVHFDDEVDDSDPRLGIPKPPVIVCNEQELRDRYLKKRLTFNSNRQCLTARDCVRQNKNPVSKSTDPVSILCSPRRNSDNTVSNIAKHTEHPLANDHHVTKIPRNSRGGHILEGQIVKSEMDIRSVGLSESEGHSNILTQGRSLSVFPQSAKKLSCSSEAILSDHGGSTNTLVGSQPNLLEMSRSCVDLTDTNYPKMSGPNSNRKRFRLKKIFHVTKQGHYNPADDVIDMPGDLQDNTKFNSMPNLCDHPDKLQPLSLPSTNPHLQNFPDKNHSEQKRETVTQQQKNIPVKEVSKDVDNQQKIPDGNHSENQTLQQHRRKLPTYEETCRIQNLSVPAEQYNSDKFQNRNNLFSTSSNSGAMNGSMTAYEASIVKLDKNGVDIDDLLESGDNDVFMAKPVVLDSNQPDYMYVCESEEKLKTRSTSKQPDHVCESADKVKTVSASRTESLDRKSESSIDSVALSARSSHSEKSTVSGIVQMESAVEKVVKMDKTSSVQETVSHGSHSGSDVPEQGGSAVIEVVQTVSPPDMKQEEPRFTEIALNENEVKAEPTEQPGTLYLISSF